MARNLVEQPRDPNRNGKNDGGSAQRSGRLRWAEVLTRYELWDDLIAANQSAALDWSDHSDRRRSGEGTIHWDWPTPPRRTRPCSTSTDRRGAKPLVAEESKSRPAAEQSRCPQPQPLHLPRRPSPRGAARERPRLAELPGIPPGQGRGRRRLQTVRQGDLDASRGAGAGAPTAHASALPRDLDRPSKQPKQVPPLITWSRSSTPSARTTGTEGVPLEPLAPGRLGRPRLPAAGADRCRVAAWCQRAGVTQGRVADRRCDRREPDRPDRWVRWPGPRRAGQAAGGTRQRRQGLNCRRSPGPLEDGDIPVGLPCQRFQRAEHLACLVVLADGVEDLDQGSERWNLFGLFLDGRSSGPSA